MGVAGRWRGSARRTSTGAAARLATPRLAPAQRAGADRRVRGGRAAAGLADCRAAVWRAADWRTRRGRTRTLEPAPPADEVRGAFDLILGTEVATTLPAVVGDRGAELSPYLQEMFAAAGPFEPSSSQYLDASARLAR